MMNSNNNNNSANNNNNTATQVDISIQGAHIPTALDFHRDDESDAGMLGQSDSSVFSGLGRQNRPREGMYVNMTPIPLSRSIMYTTNNNNYTQLRSNNTGLARSSNILLSSTPVTYSSNDNSMLSSSDFGALYDGGFHKGYWRAKYQK